MEIKHAVKKEEKKIHEHYTFMRNILTFINSKRKQLPCTDFIYFKIMKWKTKIESLKISQHLADFL